ncbi:MAG TPA: CDP-alcohol phosphatidyltransferase family protein [Anaerolineales bacterium]
MADIANHQRVNDILLGPLERPVLKWLAQRMPAWITPDICTVIGILGAVLIMFSYFLTRYHSAFIWLASLGFVINWFGDSLDGTLARLRHIERPIFGFFIDHTVDAFIQIMIFLSLGLTPYVSYPIASLALVGYMLLSIIAYVRTSAVGEFKISYGKLGPTEIRVLAILLNTSMFFGGIISYSLNLGIFGQYSLSPYDVVVGGIAALLFFFATSTAIRQSYRLRNIDKGEVPPM